MTTASVIRQIPRTLGRWDLVLLKIVAIVNINNVPPVAVYGWFSLALWLLAFATFFVPEAIAVLVLARRHPGEGGIYLWTRQEFGEAHGFLAGWCYWTNNLFYVPVLLVYMAGIFAFAGGEARAERSSTRSCFVAARGVRLAGADRRREHPRPRRSASGSRTSAASARSSASALVLWRRPRPRAAAGVSAARAGRRPASRWEMATSFAVMCNALVGIELASTMGDEIRDPERDLGPAIAIAGAVSIAVVPARHRRGAACWCRSTELGVIQGIMQAVGAGAQRGRRRLDRRAAGDR